MSVSLLVSEVFVTGSPLIYTANFMGIGGTVVLYSGNNILISGGAGGGGTVTQGQLDSLSGFTTGMSGALQNQISMSSAGVVSLNGASGALNIIGTGGISVSRVGQTIYVSGQNWATSGDISLLSGWANATFATIVNLATTGSIIYNLATGLSGQAALDYATKIQLAQTGATLYGLLVNESGALINQIAATGQQAWNAANNNGLNLSGVLQQTGSNLYALITDGSGQAVIDYATKTQLYQTGSNLYTMLINESGALTSQIAVTGQQAWTAANNNGINLSGNLTLTGQTLYNNVVATSGAAQNNGINLSGQLTLTGQTLRALTLGGDTNLSGNLTASGQTLLGFTIGGDTNLSGQLGLTGSNLYNLIVNDSGRSEGIYVHRTGNELITGIKTFLSELRFNSGVKTPAQFFGPANYTLTSGNFMVIATGTTASTTGILPSPTDYSGVIFDLINGGPVSLQVSGVIGPDINPVIAPWDAVSVYATSGQWWYIRQTGSPLLGMINSLSGFVGNVSGALSTIIAATGQQAWTAAQNNALNISGNLTITGQTLFNMIVGGDTNLSGNLTLTGQTLRALTLGGDTNLSGSLTQTGSLLSAVRVTGSSIINNANFTGLGGTLVISSGGFVFISGAAAGGGVSQGQLDSLSGWTSGTFVRLSGDEVIKGFKTFENEILASGANGVIFLNAGIQFSRINSTRFASLLTSKSVDLDNTYLTSANGNIALNWTNRGLYTTGNVLTVDWAGRNLPGEWQTTATGVDAGIIINYGRLSGHLNTISGQMAATGAALIARDLAISGVLQAQIASAAGVISLNGQQGNLLLTGTGNITVISGGAQLVIVSGDTGSYANFATRIDLTQSGIDLTARINSVGSTISGNLTASGQTLLGFIIGGDTNLSGRLTTTGQTLYNLLVGESGYNEGIYVHRTGNELISGVKTFNSGIFTGAVGIGTSAPLNPLDVNGIARFQSNLRFGALNQSGSFTLAAGTYRYIWSGAANCTGTLPAASVTSGIEFMVKNLSPTGSLVISGLIDYSQNYVLTPMQGVTLWSDNTSWLLV